MTRSRAWCYTVNNYTEEDRDALRLMPCAYNIFGYERGDEGDTSSPRICTFLSSQVVEGSEEDDAKSTS